MLTKSMMILSAALIVGSASAGLAYEAPENRFGPNYPWLEKRVQPVPPTRQAVKRFTAEEKAWFDRVAKPVF